MHIIDSLVHPQPTYRDELREYMDLPFSARPFPPPERYFYPDPLGTSPKVPRTAGKDTTASDPDRVYEKLTANGCGGDSGRVIGILVPLTRGLLPDVDLGTAVCAATNQWLVEKWLGSRGSRAAFRGTIRVNPSDPTAAVEEIEKWSNSPFMVQVGVPAESHHPYGQRMYHPIWDAASRHKLPVVIHRDGGSGVDFAPTLAGYVHHFVEYEVLQPTNFAFHLASLISEGVFERFNGLRVVFADGAIDLLKPLVWRMNKDWRSTRRDTPWVLRQPEDYLRPNVRFCMHPCEGPAPSGSEGSSRWFDLADYGNLLMYGSGYPTWYEFDAKSAAQKLNSQLWESVGYKNAADLYQL